MNDLYILKLLKTVAILTIFLFLYIPKSYSTSCSKLQRIMLEGVEGPSDNLKTMVKWKRLNSSNINSGNFNKNELIMVLHNIKDSNLNSGGNTLIEDLFTQKEIELWYSLATEHISLFTEKDITRLINLLTHVTQKDIDLHFLNSWFNEVGSRIEKFDNRELSIMINSLGRLNIRPSKEFMKQWLNEVINNGRIYNFRPREFFSTLMALSNFPDLVAPHYLEKLITASMQAGGLLDFRPDELSVFLTYISKWGIDTPISVVQHWVNATVIGQLQEFNGKNLTHSISKLTKMNIRPTHQWIEEWFISLIKNKGEKIAELNISEIVYLLHGFEVLKIKPPKEATELIQKKVLTLINEYSKGLHPDGHFALSLPFLYMRSDFSFALELYSKHLPNIQLGTAGLSDSASGQLYAFAKYANIVKGSSLKNIIPKEQLDQNNTKSVSKLQQGIARFLKKRLPKKITMVEEQFIDETGAHVDIYFPIKKLIVQVDGPHHYLRDLETGENNIFHGLHNYQNEILSTKGYKIIRISYMKWHKKDYQNEILANIKNTLK